MTQSLIGYHIVNAIDDATFNRVVSHMQRVNSAVVNYQINEQAHQFNPEKRDWRRVDQLRAALPHAMIIIRFWPDDGNWSKGPAERHYDRVIAPFREWIVAKNLIVLADNESVTDDMTAYANWHAELMYRAAQDGVRLAVGRTATGNPEHHHYAQMDSMWLALAAMRHLHVYSPNEYYAIGRDNDLVGRYRRAWARCDTIGCHRPVTTIGEFGLVVANGDYLDPHKGYRRLPTDSRAYARQVADYARRDYDGVPLAVYCAGEWHGFEIDDAFMAEIEREENRVTYIPQSIPIHPPISVDDARWEPARLTGNGTRIRSAPTTASAVLASIGEQPMAAHTIRGAKLSPTELQHVTRNDGVWLHVKLSDNRVGFVRSDVVAVTYDAPPVETPAPEPPPADFVTRAELTSTVLALVHKLRDEYARRDEVFTIHELTPLFEALGRVLDARTASAPPASRSIDQSDERKAS